MIDKNTQEISRGVPERSVAVLSNSSSSESEVKPEPQPGTPPVRTRPLTYNNLCCNHLCIEVSSLFIMMDWKLRVLLRRPQIWLIDRPATCKARRVFGTALQTHFYSVYILINTLLPYTIQAGPNTQKHRTPNQQQTVARSSRLHRTPPKLHARSVGLLRFFFSCFCNRLPSLSLTPFRPTPLSYAHFALSLSLLLSRLENQSPAFLNHQ